MATSCGFESHHRHQLVASDISLATSFFISLQSSSRAHSAAPRFQTGPAVAGLRFGAAAARRFCQPLKNINFDRPFHVGAKSALLRRLFMPEAKETSSVPSLLRLPCSAFPAADRSAGSAAGLLNSSRSPPSSQKLPGPQWSRELSGPFRPCAAAPAHRRDGGTACCAICRASVLV